MLPRWAAFAPWPANCSTPADALVSGSDLITAIADMTDPATFEGGEDPADPGHQAPDGGAVAAASLKGIGVQKSLGEIAEELTGESFATPWGRPERLSGIGFARALAPLATGKRDRPR